MAMPAVSIIIPCYNTAKFVSIALDSILGQTCNNYEVIIIDDGSTDNTRSVIRTYLSKKIKYIFQENSGGPSNPRNVGIDAAIGEYISFFDSDDIMMPKKIEYYLRIFEKQANVDFIFSDFSVVDEFGKTLKKSFLKDYQSFRRILLPTSDLDVFYLKEDQVYTELLLANFIGTSSVMVKKKTLNQIGRFDESLKNSDDIDLWRRFARENKKFAFLNKIGHCYRKRSSSISTKNLKRFPSILNALEKQKRIVKYSKDLKILNQKIFENLISYGWHSRNNGLYKQAIKCYLKALSIKISYTGLKGIFASIFLIINPHKKKAQKIIRSK
jgi:glycosyltransferase involved in cell wall biosynthesis